MAHLLGAEALHHEFQNGVVFDSVTLGINEGDRIGIVGRNGDGKSTLLLLLAGRLQPNSGRVTRRRGVTTAMLDQADALDPSLTVGRAIVGEVPDHVWAGDPRIRDILEGLVATFEWDTPVSELSGGQRRRVSLARVLATDADVLFLDEPTNHLDIAGITWLAEHLKRRWAASDGGLAVVTHDRWFLDEVCTTTWEVHDRRVEPFEGGYAAYILQRVERDRMAAVTEAKRQNLMRKELAWLRRGAPARTTKAKFRVEAANALIAHEPPPRDNVELMRMATSRLGREVVNLLDVSVSFDGKQVLRNVEWLIKPGERTGILGVNGAGKSTLLNVITGAIEPTSGVVKRGSTVRIATLTQSPAALDELSDERVSDILKRERHTYVAGGKEMTPAQLLERLGFKAAQLSNPVGKLSGGQKRRLQLLLILLNEPNVLLLDEPTNDLDTDMLAAMEDLLDYWPGTLLVASHDRYLMERVTDQQYAILDGRLLHMPGGVDQYLDLLRQSRGQPPPPTPRRRNVDVRVEREVRKEIASIERKLAKLPGQIGEVNERIAAHDQADYLGLQVLVDEMKALQARMSDLESRWLELSEQLEASG
ncbi:MAG TPA: ABC-F family ATP-binding cassette domain-containing protein [Actinomycetota bacterium]|nr:ABC-F family ATP-binding cassette domain-containing protein [Actinomycetota bacterium]